MKKRERILEQGWKEYEPENAKETILPTFKRNRKRKRSGTERAAITRSVMI